MAARATAQSVARDLSIVESIVDELKATVMTPGEADDLTVLSLAEEWPDAMSRLRDLETSARQGSLTSEQATRLATSLDCLLDLAPRAAALGLRPIPVLRD